MPSPPLSNSFNGGTDGVTISSANSGGGSGDAFSAVTGTGMKFTNVQTHSSPMAARGVDVTGDNSVIWDTLGSLTVPVYFRWYMWLAAWPTGNRHYVLELDTNAAAQCAFIRIFANGTGIVSAADATDSGFGAEGTVGVNLSAWFRLECKVVASTTVGTLEWRLFNSPDSTTITDTKSGTGLTLGANIDHMAIGNLHTAPTAPYTFYIDDVAVSTTDWIGPSAAPTAADNPPIGFLGRGAGW